MLTTVTDASQVAQARRRVTEFAEHAGASKAQLGAIALATTELATNLVKHGSGGEIVAGPFSDREGSGVEILALDRGAGMGSVERCMQDGFSTAGSLGHGLGAVSRQSDHLRIWSQPGHGTVVQARFVLRSMPEGAGIECGAAMSPYPGEVVCGDAWTCAASPSRPTLMMADGSGHGPEAARAANIAVDIMRKHSDEACEELVQRLHRALVSTRGAALAVAQIDVGAQVVRYAGIGNISGTMIAGNGIHRMVSNNGIAGHQTPRVREFVYGYAGRPLVILHSDGVSTRWDVNAYSGLAVQHPSIVSAVLFRDFRRGRDDATVAALRLVQ